VWSYVGIDQPFYNLFFVGFGPEEMFQADTQEVSESRFYMFL
jgi:hypothetical protein